MSSLNFFVKNTSPKVFFDRLAPKRMRDVKRHRAYYVDRLRWLKRLIRIDASIIDLGSGTGHILSQLPQRKKVGMDFSDEMVRIAREHDSTSEYIVDDIENMNHTGEYDYVLMLDTINFLSDVQKGLEQVRKRLCHAGTRLVITHYNFLWQPIFIVGQFLGWKTRFPEQNWLSRSDIENLLSISGFEVVQYGERCLLPLAVPVIATIFNKYLSSLPMCRAFCLSKCIIARPVSTEQHEYSVTVLSAVRNERGNIRKIVDAMPLMGRSTELCIIEGHSTDGTWEEMQNIVRGYKGHLKLKMIKQSGDGKGNALHEGIAASSGEVLFIYDGDFTVHPSELPKLYNILSSGKAEFVNASRLVYPMQDKSMKILNLIGNKIFSALFSWMFGQRLVDTLTPVKGLFRKNYAYMPLRRDPFGDFDFFIGAAAQQLKFREVPIHYLERSYGTTKMRRFKHAWFLLRIWVLGSRMLKWI